MTRRSLLFATIVAAGCGKQSSDFQFPAKVNGWTRSGSPASVAPLPSARRAWRAHYTGLLDVTITVTINEMSSSAVALDAIQRWRSETRQMPFFRDKYFGVAEATPGGANDLAAFVGAFEEASAK